MGKPLPAVLLFLFILLQGADGQTFFINAKQITSLREPIGTDLRRFPHGIHCVISTTDGKFVPVRETCGEVRARIEETRQ